MSSVCSIICERCKGVLEDSIEEHFHAKDFSFGPVALVIARNVNDMIAE